MTVGRYEILERLGEGSMGIIYRAKDRVLERDVALKTLSTAGASDAELLERFYREARACAKLRHPNIVTIYDFGEEKDLAYIAMELLEGSDLRSIIAERRPMPLAQKLLLMAGVCDGLHHAHTCGIVHRDIKPSNIFISTDGQARILDFGVAHMPASSLTIIGRVLGTPYYMAPEQMLGHECEARSDVFSAAIVTFELIAGQHPFRGSPMKRITEGRPDSLHSLNPELPVELDAVLFRGLAREPEARYSSAAEFALALRQAADKSLNLVARPQVPERTKIAAPALGTETRMSAVLTNLRVFEEAVEAGDVSAARQAIAQMRQAGAQDSRFVVALEQSEKQLAELENRFGDRIEEVAPTMPPPEPEPLPVPVQQPASIPTPVRATDATQLFDQASGPAPVCLPVAIQPAISKPGPSPASLVVPASPSARAKASEAKGRTLAPSNVSRVGWALPLAALLCAAGIGAFVLLRRTHTEPVRLPAIALAEVVGAQAPLFARPDAGEHAVATVHQGATLNVLRAARSREQQWTEVQWVSGGRATPAVFARTSDLGNWSSSNEDLARELQQIFGPPRSQDLP